MGLTTADLWESYARCVVNGTATREAKVEADLSIWRIWLGSKKVRFLYDEVTGKVVRTLPWPDVQRQPMRQFVCGDPPRGSDRDQDARTVVSKPHKARHARTKHAKWRSRNRLGSALTPRQCEIWARTIQNGNAHFLDRKDRRITRWVLEFRGQDVVVVYDEVACKIVTVYEKAQAHAK
jgi:hypothetical protein